MSPKPVDIDHAINHLKADGSTQEMRANARAILSSPKRNALPKFGLVGIAASVAIFIAWPRATAGRTWAQALQSSIKATIVHASSRDSEGKVRFERWVSDRRITAISYNANGKLTGEMRSNGAKVFSYYSNIGAPERVGKNVNAHRFGMVHKDNILRPKSGGGFEGKLDQFLKLNGCEVLNQKPVTLPSGPAIRYEVREKRGQTEHELVDVDDSTGVIVQLTETMSGYKTAFDYPKDIDDSIFEPKPKIVKDCIPIDWLEMEDRVRRTVENGIASANGVTLRLVALDSRGDIWAAWTGKNVTEEVKHPFTVTGIQLGKPFLLPQVSNGGPHYKYGPEVMQNGERLYGMAREAISKVGDTVDISVPTKRGGFVKFKSVPILRVGLFEPGYFAPKKKPVVPVK